MPQILKDDVRERIENSALDVLIEKGMRDTDMRSIAKKAGVTPGNLYRYFKNKDQLIVSLTKPMIESLNQIVGQETGGEVTLADTDINFQKIPNGVKPQEYIYTIIKTKLTSALMKIAIVGKANPKRMKILLCNTLVGDNLRGWATILVTRAFNACFIINTATEYQTTAMIKIFTLSFCEGAQQLFIAGLETDIENFERLMTRFVKVQLNAIMALINNEIKSETILPNREVFPYENQ